MFVLIYNKKYPNSLLHTTRIFIKIQHILFNIYILLIQT